MLLVSKLKLRLKLIKFKKQWRKKNSHNTTVPMQIFDMDLVSVGRYTYGNLNVLMFNGESTLKIGDFCSIAPGAVFILSADHHTNYVSTFPFKVKCLSEGTEGVSKGNIVVDDDVWIGYGAVILSGVHIGQGAVVAAGAIVTKDVPPYTIVGGNPARVIKHRFSDDICQKLEHIDFSKLTVGMIEEHLDVLYKPVKDIQQVSWMPQK